MLDKVTPSSFAKMAFLSAVQLFFVLVYSFALVSPNTNISTNDSGQDIGEYADDVMTHGASTSLIVVMRMLMESSNNHHAFRDDHHDNHDGNPNNC